ncbi:MAG: hypothetical protein AB7I59_10130 [Geminicoccaceae bacterium]
MSHTYRQLDLVERRTIFRLVSAILLEPSGERTVQRARCMTVEAMSSLDESAVVSLPTLAD